MSTIQDGEVLFRYAKPEAFPLDQIEIPAAIFNDPNLSCDWKKLQSAPASSPHVEDGLTMVVSIAICAAIRTPENPKRSGEYVADWQQEILHDPLKLKPDDRFTPNESHALIKGKKKGAVTTAIRDNSTVERVVFKPREQQTA